MENHDKIWSVRPVVMAVHQLFDWLTSCYSTV